MTAMFCVERPGMGITQGVAGTKGHSVLRKKTYVVHSPGAMRRAAYNFDDDNTGGMVLVTTKTRSVPVETEYYDEYTPDIATRNALRHSSAAVYESEAVHSASRRQDRKLLNDITEKLAETTVNGPVRVLRRPLVNRPVKGSLPGKRISVHRQVANVVPRRGHVTRSRKHATPSLSSPVTIATLPVQPLLPPRPKAPIHINRYNHYNHYKSKVAPLSTMAPLYHHGTAVSVASSVGRAKRILDNMERELEMPAPIYYPAPRPVLVRPTSRPLARRVATPRTTGRRHTYPAVSLAPPKRNLLSLQARMEVMEDYEFPQESLRSLKSRTIDAKTKMDIHKTMMDRYLTPDEGPVLEVDAEVDRRYEELAYRMPSLSASYRSFTYGNPHSTGPARSASSVSSPVYSKYGGSSQGSTMPKPQMSDARKRARDVLCRTKRDPTYYSG